MRNRNPSAAAETDAAISEATRGALAGAAKVSHHSFLISHFPLR